MEVDIILDLTSKNSPFFLEIEWSTKQADHPWAKLHPAESLADADDAALMRLLDNIIKEIEE